MIAIRAIFVTMAALALPAQDAREIVRRSVERDQSNFERAKDYTFIRHEEMRFLDGKGRVTKTGSSAYDVTIIGGRPYQRKIERNGKPLTGKEAQEAHERFERTVAKRQRESDAERGKRIAAEERERAESRAFMREIPDAFTFELKGEELVDGMPVWVVAGTPRPGFRGHVKHWELLTKFRGRLWIAKDSYEWVKADVESVAPVSFGLVLARLAPGTRVTMEQRMVNGEVWLPAHVTTHLDARLALLKKIRVDADVRWSDYRKFDVDSRIVSTEELPKK